MALMMAGHDRFYQPPRSLRRAALDVTEPTDLQRRIAAGQVSAWDMLRMEEDWATSTLDSVLASLASEGRDALGCTDCQDTGFYGIPSVDNPDLLVGMVKRGGEGDGEYSTLTADGTWKAWEDPTNLALEVLSLELAEDLADAIVTGADGLLRKFTVPVAFLPPAAVVSAAKIKDIDDSASSYLAIVDDDDPGAVLAFGRNTPDGDLERYVDGAWEPWGAVDSDLQVVPVPEAQFQALVADAPLTVSPDPRAEKLRRYWSTGEGAAKIRWNTPGDWKRCVRHLAKFMGDRAKGYCFTGDTEFVTRDGVMNFRDACDTTQFVLTQERPREGTYSTPIRADGYWVQAPIRSFGEQPVLSVTLQRGGITKTIRATPEHRWIASPNSRNVRRFDAATVLTRDLQPGMALAALSAQQPTLPVHLPPDAICAGAVFGDGSRAGRAATRIDLYQAKRELTDLFVPFASSVSVGKTMTSTEHLADRIYGLPAEWKDAPGLDRSDHWLAGWLAGYIATDGSVGTRGTVTLSSARPEHLRLVRDICVRLGIMTSEVRSTLRSGGYESVSTLCHRVNLYSHTVPAEILVRSDHRRRFHRPTRSGGRWTVVSVQDLGEREEVFCATVPETESFVLTDEIWSLNCQNLHKRNDRVWTGDRRNPGGNGHRGRGFHASLAAAIDSGQWTGEPERTTPMPGAITDGIYTEVDEENTAILRTLTAGGFPVAPPDEWFQDPKLTGPTPLTVDDDGRVYGHIATFDVTHIGMAGKVHAPKSRSGYAFFRTGQMVTASGAKVPVGQLTLAGGHAPLHAGIDATVKHYDDTGSAVADLTAGEDKYGVWVAGGLRPDVTPTQIRALRASAPSGDWRPINGGLELVAICQVNVPGFPVARALRAGGEIVALVAAGAAPLYKRRLALTADALVLERLDRLEQQVFPEAGDATPQEDPETPTPEPAPEPEPVPEPEAESEPPVQAAAPEIDRDALRTEVSAIRRDILRRSVHSVTAATAAPAKPGKGERPGIGGFPINNEEDLKNAIHAYGRAKPEDRARTRQHIITRAKALGLSNLIPIQWRGPAKSGA